MSARPRIVALTLAFLLAGCAAQVGAPRSTTTEVASPTATARPTNAAGDLLYARVVASGPVASTLLIDARTGATLKTLPDAAFSPDRATLYATEQVLGATQTIVRAMDVASGRELRSFTLDGALRPLWSDGAKPAVSADGRLAVFAAGLVQIEREWVTRLVVVDITTGTPASTFETKSAATFGFAAFSPDGRSLFLDRRGDSVTQLRILDVPSATLLPPSAISVTQSGFRTVPAFSKDGRWMYSFDTGGPETNCTSTDGSRCVPNAKPPALIAVDLLGRTWRSVALPADHQSTDFERMLIWSVVLSPNGDTVLAINPALGIVDEIDTATLSLRRTTKITISRDGDGGLVAAIGRFFFPVAEAKRWMSAGAVFSPDGKRIYVAGYKGVAVLDATSLNSETTWLPQAEFDILALTTDGERLYAVSNSNGKIEIVRTRDGVKLGEIKLSGYNLQAIVRIDPAR